MKIGFIGTGKMAEGVLQAILPDVVSPADVVVLNRTKARQEEICSRYGVSGAADLADLLAKADVVFLAVRPQDVAGVAAEARFTERHLLVSIVAGKTLAKLAAAFGASPRIVRVMPNLALRVKRGMCAVCGSANARKEDLAVVTKLLSAAGEVAELDERHFDAVTAVSGSGPAFFAFAEQAMIEGGVKLGLPADAARLLAEQTMLGTALYLKTTAVDLGSFIAGVATKGGTTEAGMNVLAASDVKEVFAKTVKATADRSAALA